MPSAIVLSHYEQLSRLSLAYPEAVPHTVVAGDICFDRLRASLPLRPSYRRAFGLAAHQKLVVVSTTWGPDSLLAAAPDLPRRLAEVLPVDEFRILLAPHPNIRAGHSAWQFAEYLSGAARAGVYVPDDIDMWRSAIIAADLVVGDHGSVPFYSTALGNPLLLATVPAHSVDPRSPIARLLRTAPRLDLSGDLLAQVRRAIELHDPQRYSPITALTTSEPDRSAAILRTAMYRMMGLAEPGEPAEISTLPMPSNYLTGPDSHLVLAEITAVRTAAVNRFPAERLRSDPDVPRGAHVVIGVNEPRRRWLEVADIVIGDTGPETREWVAATLSRLPGCVLAAAPVDDRRWLLGVGGGRFLAFEGSATACRLFASVAYHGVVRGAGLDSMTGHWTIECGGGVHRVRAVAPNDDHGNWSTADRISAVSPANPKSE
ncbi:hypothetical protein HLB23_40605 [Nocardia uniformis]|uniref:Uncharacterized protein n=1 Tax=Nocardia uniformis TaxID=53432 RepID=A0A849CDW7_9NOCA|nr:hypothetical protein [Nocardia uniformis]NNH76078.1 hypothetical protein [Nocardia uniformis]